MPRQDGNCGEQEKPAPPGPGGGEFLPHQQTCGYGRARPAPDRQQLAQCPGDQRQQKAGAPGVEVRTPRQQAGGMRHAGGERQQQAENGSEQRGGNAVAEQSLKSEAPRPLSDQAERRDQQQGRAGHREWPEHRCTCRNDQCAAGDEPQAATQPAGGFRAKSAARRQAQAVVGHQVLGEGQGVVGPRNAEPGVHAAIGRGRLHAGQRRLPPAAFEAVATATLGRLRLNLTHHNRETNQTIERTVSPQQLVHYRDNWYLDAWCHLRNGFRSFAVDAMTAARVLPDEPAHEMDADTLRRATQASYGIFSGEPVGLAVLRFSAERARWVSGEQWHPEQVSQWLPDGSYRLTLPYSDDRELLGDILRHGSHCVVESPPSLRDKTLEALQAACAAYVG
mgnify:CR=1 FL=1